MPAHDGLSLVNREQARPDQSDLSVNTKVMLKPITGVVPDRKGVYHRGRVVSPFPVTPEAVYGHARDPRRETGMPNYNNSRLELLSTCIAGVTVKWGRCQKVIKLTNPKRN